ncbi:MAG: hypothetical protein RLZZ571_690 [Actinomycetota bacterium]
MNFLEVTSADLLIAICLFFGAILYTSVGHAGSSIYIAIMSLFGLAGTEIKPTALVLNIFVSAFTSWRFLKAKLFDLKLFTPLAIGAIPMSFIGGSIELSNEIYKPIVGALLLLSGLSFISQLGQKVINVINPPNFTFALLIGGAIGLLAGLTGTGGGIFLSPIALLLSWTAVKQLSGTAAVFILVNSSFGLLGHISSVNNLPSSLPVFVVAVMAGALVGTKLGIAKFSNAGVRKALGFVLLIAGLKLMAGF